MKIDYYFLFLLLLTLTACSAKPSPWENSNEQGAFVAQIKQSPIGEETYKITATIVIPYGRRLIFNSEKINQHKTTTV